MWRSQTRSVEISRCNLIRTGTFYSIRGEKKPWRTDLPPRRPVYWEGRGSHPTLNAFFLRQAILRRGLESARQNILHALELVAVLRVASNVPKRLEVRPDSETAGRIARLSATQREVLERVIRGESNKTIAFDLGISTKSVETHRSRVMRRLGADSLAELVRMADRAGSSIGRGS